MRYRTNLLPDDVKARKSLRLGDLIMVLLVVFFITGLVTVGVMYERRFIAIQKGIASLNFQKNQLLFEEDRTKEILRRIEGIQARQAEDGKVVNLLESLIRGKIFWSRILAQITYIVPEGVWLNSLSSSGRESGRELVLRGTALSNKWVARFLFYLENHPDFSGVSLKYSRLTKMAGRDLYGFEVHAVLSPGAGRF
ncbi:MAG TPA: hypothetical protein ENH32_08800 [Proteobacteria bacterium]|nr:fimbrial assembly protein (PilN) [bacterium BMS3Abin14]HDL54059.1 hypothetical protein [Pseudomonadota bacterium]